MLTKSTKESLIAVYVYCFNPASIFFSSLYTESTYLFFVLMALIVLHKDADWLRFPIAACVFAFSYLTRANGFLNIGYIAYPLFIDCLVYRDAEGRLQVEQTAWSVAEKVCFILIVFKMF